MYLDLFQLKELPFRLSPDPQFLFLSKHHARAKAYMESTIWFTDGFVVITGEIGAGKTTLIESFLRDVDPSVVIAQISQTQVTPVAFLQGLLVQFGFSPFKMQKAELLATINSFLVEQYAAGRKVLLVVDEAQGLSTRVLEEIRMLSGVETTKDKTLRIILAGQPELNDRLNAPDLVQLAQRIRLRFHLTTLSAEESAAYIRHRLEVAGAAGREIFTPGALDLVFRYAGGVPRLTNTLCDTAMLGAFARDHATIDEAEVRAAVDELQWTEYAARTNRFLKIIDSRIPIAADAPLVGRLYVTTQGRATATHELKAGRFIVGRTRENDIQLESKFVSRHHCQLNVTPDAVVLEDLNSTNGIAMGGRRIRRAVLRDGDVVAIGQFQLRFADERGSHTYPAAGAALEPPAPGDTGTVARALLPRAGNGPH
jgi:type II secretory pathway predicted ATPase ExeA